MNAASIEYREELGLISQEQDKVSGRLDWLYGALETSSVS